MDFHRKQRAFRLALGLACILLTPARVTHAQSAAPPARKTPTAPQIAIEVVDDGGKPIAGATVLVGDHVATTDEQGRARLVVEAGASLVRVQMSGFAPLEVTEQLEAGEQLSVRYQLRAATELEDSGEVIVITGQWSGQRSEVGRITLTGDELVAVPGTMGDPLRVITLLPGVTTGTSGLGYPIIRGELPGDSRFEIDGIEIPMLFHFLIAGAVMHPRVVGELSFEPGGFGAQHGRAIGGRVAAGVAEPKQRLTEVSASLVEAAAVYADALGEKTTLTLATRAGTIGLLAKLVDPNVSFYYVDYQARVTHQLDAHHKLTFTALGALDIFNFEEDDVDTGDPNDDDSLNMGFHRVEARHDYAAGKWRTRASLQSGLDVFQLGGRQDASTYLVRAGGEVGYQVLPWLELSAGADAAHRWATGGNAEESFDLDFADAIRPKRNVVLGAYLRSHLELGPMELEPGMRVDHYRYDTALGDHDYTSFDPRLLASYRLHPQLKLRAAAGIYHGMSELTVAEGPVVVGPIPGSDGLSAQYGLSRSVQFQLGGELELPHDFVTTLTGYSQTSKHGLDYSLLLAEGELQVDPCTGVSGTSGDDTPAVAQVSNIKGQAYGVELLVRRKLGSAVSGWVSATYARSRRTIPQFGEVRYSYEQPFVFNAAVLWRPGSWILGATGHVHIGRPFTPFTTRNCPAPGGGEAEFTTRGAFNSARLPPFWRVDLRAERVFQFENWKLSVYLDFFNALLQREAVDANFDDGRLEYDRLRLFLPMIGARGEF